jgi:uncharacterized membrane protein (DUF106 family)
MVFETLLDPVFFPFLRMPPFWAILIVSLLISLIITIAYKYLTDQTMMKDLKQRQKDFQKKMKSLKGEPEKLMKVQKEAMEVNMKYMKHSFRPTIITFLPIIIIFSWFNAHMAFEPIMPEQNFTATLFFEKGYTGDVKVDVPDGIEVMGASTVAVQNRIAQFVLSGEEGDYEVYFDYDNYRDISQFTITNERGQMYAPVKQKVKHRSLQSITVSSDRKLIVINPFDLEQGGISKLRFGWLGTYIIFSIVFSLGLRKVLKIY